MWQDHTQIYCNYHWGDRKGKKKELPGLLIWLEFICRIQNAQINSNTAWVYTQKSKSSSTQIYNSAGVNARAVIYIYNHKYTQLCRLHTLNTNSFYLSLQKLLLRCCFAFTLFEPFQIWKTKNSWKIREKNNSPLIPERYTGKKKKVFCVTRVMDWLWCVAGLSVVSVMIVSWRLSPVAAEAKWGDDWRRPSLNRSRPSLSEQVCFTLSTSQGGRETERKKFRCSHTNRKPPPPVIHTYLCCCTQSVGGY